MRKFINKNLIKNKEEALEKLKKEVENCQRCPLYKMRKKAIFGEGPANAKIMIVAQAPGQVENLKGKPFIGPAGKFLDELLKMAGLERNKIFITSALKCLPQPPINRKPKKEELKACLPWLKKQIEIINAQKFILLGEVAFSVFFPGEKLTDFRGKWIKKGEKEFFITYHPAAGMRFPKIRKILEKDFKKLKKLSWIGNMLSIF